MWVFSPLIWYVVIRTTHKVARLFAFFCCQMWESWHFKRHKDVNPLWLFLFSSFALNKTVAFILNCSFSQLHHEYKYNVCKGVFGISTQRSHIPSQQSQCIAVCTLYCCELAHKSWNKFHVYRGDHVFKRSIKHCTQWRWCRQPCHMLSHHTECLSTSSTHNKQWPASKSSHSYLGLCNKAQPPLPSPSPPLPSPYTTHTN